VCASVLTTGEKYDKNTRKKKAGNRQRQREKEKEKKREREREREGRLFLIKMIANITAKLSQL